MNRFTGRRDQGVSAGCRRAIAINSRRNGYERGPMTMTSTWASGPLLAMRRYETFNSKIECLHRLTPSLDYFRVNGHRYVLTDYTDILVANCAWNSELITEY